MLQGSRAPPLNLHSLEHTQLNKEIKLFFCFESNTAPYVCTLKSNSVLMVFFNRNLYSCHVYIWISFTHLNGLFFFQFSDLDIIITTNVWIKITLYFITGRKNKQKFKTFI